MTCIDFSIYRDNSEEEAKGPHVLEQYEQFKDDDDDEEDDGNEPSVPSLDKSLPDLSLTKQSKSVKRSPDVEEGKQEEPEQQALPNGSNEDE